MELFRAPSMGALRHHELGDLHCRSRQNRNAGVELDVGVRGREMAAGRRSHGKHIPFSGFRLAQVCPRRGTLSLAMPPILAIVGPTATGKSELGMGLAEALGGEIVNADALQVY